MIESNYVFSTKGVSIGYKLLSTLSTLRSGHKVGKNNFEEKKLCFEYFARKTNRQKIGNLTHLGISHLARLVRDFLLAASSQLRVYGNARDEKQVQRVLGLDEKRQKNPDG